MGVDRENGVTYNLVWFSLLATVQLIPMGGAAWGQWWPVFVV